MILKDKMITVKIPSGCIRKEAEISPLKNRETDLPSPQPGQKLKPAL